MEDFELRNIWSAYDRKIEEARILNMQSWALNLRVFETLQTEKAKSKLNSLANFKIFAVVLGVLWLLFLGVLVYGNQLKNLFFTFSLSAIIIFTIIAIVVYIRHIIIIKQINYSGSITETQQKLARLQSSTLNIGRILWLQAPFYCTWFWTADQFTDTRFWLISVPITLAFVFLSLWLFRNINIKNMDKKWFKIMFGNIEWTALVKARDFMREIEEFKQDMV